MSNVDHQELHKFEVLASRWWDLNGPMKPLHAINPLRLQFIQEHCQLNNQSVLDVGCGGGILSESLAQAGASVTGIDPNTAVIDVARLHALESKLSIQYHAHTAESYHAAPLDIITCMELLEHVPDPAALILRLSQLLKPQGKLFLSTINRTPKAYLFAILAAEHLLKLVPKGTHDYAKCIKPSELRRWCEAAGLRFNAMMGFSYNPLNSRYFLTPSVSVNYLVYTEKI